MSVPAGKRSGKVITDIPFSMTFSLTLYQCDRSTIFKGGFKILMSMTKAGDINMSMCINILASQVIILPVPLKMKIWR